MISVKASMQLGAARITMYIDVCQNWRTLAISVDLTGGTDGGGDTKSYDNKNIIMIQNDLQQKPSENIKNDLLHIFL